MLAFQNCDLAWALFARNVSVGGCRLNQEPHVQPIQTCRGVLQCGYHHLHKRMLGQDAALTLWGDQTFCLRPMGITPRHAGTSCSQVDVGDAGKDWH